MHLLFPFVIFRDTGLLLCNSIRFPVVPFHSFIIGDIAYSGRYCAERENSRYNRNFSMIKKRMLGPICGTKNRNTTAGRTFAGSVSEALGGGLPGPVGQTGALE